MTRAITIIWVVLTAVAAASADRLILTDGRAFTGTITAETVNTISIETDNETLSFLADDVAELITTEQLLAQLAEQIAQTPSDDPNALCKLASWARENGLSEQADELYQAAMKLDANCVEARHGLGYVLADGEWRTLADGLDLARREFEAGQYDLLADLQLDELDAACRTTNEACAVADLRGLVLLRTGQFTEALKVFVALAVKADPPPAYRYETIAQLLQDNPEGLYLANSSQEERSLADPQVLQDAMSDRAREYLQAGRKLLIEATQADSNDPNRSEAAFGGAAEAFARANALVEGAGRIYQVELARREVGTLRQDVQSGSSQFDSHMDSLGQSRMSGEDYRLQIEAMIASLDQVRDGLTHILEIAAPFPVEMQLDIQWAMEDLECIERMRAILIDELGDEPDGDQPAGE